MNKFKVGDYVRGTNIHDYAYTNENMTRGKVTKIFANGNVIMIKIIKHKTDKEQIGHTFSVSPLHFELISSSDTSEEKTDEYKFKVGDIVKGIEGAPYCITNQNMLEGKIVHISSDDKTMIIKVLKHKNDDSIGERFDVDTQYFKLVRKAK